MVRIGVDMKQASDTLMEAIRLVRKGWTRYSSARDKKGRYVNNHSDKAASFCMSGAVDACALNGEKDVILQAIGEILMGASYPRADIAGWNDRKGRTQNEVIKVMLEAYRLLRDREDDLRERGVK